MSQAPSTESGHTVNMRDYDKARMQKIAAAIWKGMLIDLKDAEGRVFMPMGEVLDAMALVGGMMMATHPDAKTPSRLREMCADHGKNLADRTRQAIASPEASKIFDVVLTEADKFN